MKRLFVITLLLSILIYSAITPCNAATTSYGIDTSKKTQIYENTFDTVDSLSDFTQYNGKFTVTDGRAKLSSYSKATNAYMLYHGSINDLNSSSSYVVELDLYNVQTAAGLVAFCEREKATEQIHGYSGYNVFTSSTGQKLAVRSSGEDGKSTSSLKVCSWRINPGDDLHIEAAVSGEIVQVRFFDLNSGRELWTYSTVNTEHRGVAFGIMAYTRIYDGKLDCRKSSFDNLRVSLLNEKAGASPLNNIKGKFITDNDRITSQQNGSLATIDGISQKTGTVSAKTFLPSQNTAGVIFSYSEDGSYYKFGISSDKKLHLQKIKGAKATTLKTTSLSAMGIGPFGVCELRAVYDGENIYCYINGMCLICYKDKSALQGDGIGVYSDNAEHTLYGLSHSDVATPDRADIVIWGHSHMQGWYFAEQTLADYGKVANIGVGGSNTPYWNKLTDEISSYGADTVIVMSGSNDLKSYSNTQTLSTLKDTFNKIKSKNPDVHFILITEWFQPSRIDEYENKVKDMEKLWRRFGEENPSLVTVVDGFSIPLNENGKFSDTLFSDTQHFGILGYEELEIRVKAALDKIKNGIPAGTQTSADTHNSGTSEPTGSVGLDTQTQATVTQSSSIKTTSIVVLTVSITTIVSCAIIMVLILRKKKT